MKNQRVLPIPFLILILAGTVSVFSILADRGSKAAMVRDDSLKMQTVEQERMAEFYFRILSWLSDFTPRTPDPAKPNPQHGPAPRVLKTPQRHARQGKIALCTVPSTQCIAAVKHRTPNLN